MSDWYEDFKTLVKNYCAEIDCPGYDYQNEQCRGKEDYCELENFANWYYESGWVNLEEKEGSGNNG